MAGVVFVRHMAKMQTTSGSKTDVKKKLIKEILLNEIAE
jgi:hypothetical protein